MAAGYFQVEEDFPDGRWHLRQILDREGTRLDGREFVYGQVIELGPPIRTRMWNQYKMIDAHQPLRMKLSRKGFPLDLTFSDESTPVATLRVGDIISSMAPKDTQRIPIEIEGQGYEIINVTQRFDCIDRNTSDVMWWTEADDRPEDIGRPKMVSKLMIDPKRVGSSDLFRIEGWPIALIASARLKAALEAAHVTGIKFLPV